MRKSLFVIFTLAFACGGQLAAGGGPVSRAAVPQQRQEAVVPLEGLDPVLLAQGKEAQGDEQFAVTRGRFRYLFAGAETKAAFEREPARYEIQLGGTCARMGPTVRGDPDLFHVHEGRVYLFGSPACLNAFRAAPARFLEASADAPPAASEESRARGRALLEKAVEAAGGAARVDSLKSYQERATTGAQGGGTEVKTSLVVSFPDRFRYERALSFGPLATVVTPADGFESMPRMTGTLVDEQRAAFLRQFRLRLLPLLRARREAGFVAASAGAGRAGGASVELVDVSFDGRSARLGIDPSTGRVLSLTWRGRGQGGEFGEVVQTFSDFRPVGGLTLPFKTAATFNGEADPARTVTVEEIVLNAEVAPALFDRPKPAAGEQ
jgi:YHS domain-containing protein